MRLLCRTRKQDCQVRSGALGDALTNDIGPSVPVLKNLSLLVKSYTSISRVELAFPVTGLFALRRKISGKPQVLYSPERAALEHMSARSDLRDQHALEGPNLQSSKKRAQRNAFCKKNASEVSGLEDDQLPLTESVDQLLHVKMQSKHYFSNNKKGEASLLSFHEARRKERNKT